MTDRQRGRQKDRQTVNRHKRTRKRNVGKKDSFPAERSRMEKRRMNIRKRPPPEKKRCILEENRPQQNSKATHSFLLLQLSMPDITMPIVPLFGWMLLLFI